MQTAGAVERRISLQITVGQILVPSGFLELRYRRGVFEAATNNTDRW
jgi:hypothetical protein